MYAVPVHRAIVAALAAAGSVAFASAAVLSADDSSSSRPAGVVRQVSPDLAAGAGSALAR